MARTWHLYILDCDGTALYTGISTDPGRRLEEHRSRLPEAAKYTRKHRQIELAYSLPVGPRGLALRLEQRLKGLSRPAKQAVVAAQPDLPGLLRTLGLKPDPEGGA